MFQLTIVCPQCRKQFVVVDTLEDARGFRCPVCAEIALRSQKIAGFVYILSNELMPGIVKIGFTERTVADRISELSGHTGVALPYKEEASFPVADPSKIERSVHEGLRQHRVSQNREFFRLSPDEATAAVRQILGLSTPLPKSVSPGAKAVVSRSSPKIAPLTDSEIRTMGIIPGGFGSSRYEEKG